MNGVMGPGHLIWREGGKKSVPLWEEGGHVSENTSLNLPSQGETWSCLHWTSYH